MDELLAGLHEAGRVESTARFSVDVLRANQKLRQFQLADPGFYLVKLVQAAVALGSTAVAVRLQRDQVEVGFDPQQSVAELPQALLEGRRSTGGIHHLIVALSGALAWDPVELTFGVAGQYELRLQAEGLVVLPSPGNGGRCYFRMLKQPQPASFWQRLFQGVQGNLAESTAVSRRCRFAPVPVILDGRPVNAPFPETVADLWPVHARPVAGAPISRVAAELVVWGPPGVAGLCAPLVAHRLPAIFDPGEPVFTGSGARSRTGLWMLRSPRDGSPFPSSPLPEVTLSADPFAPVEYRGPSPDGEGTAHAILTYTVTKVESRLAFVVDGALLNHKTLDLGWDGVVAVVAASGLTVDLSESEVVEDARYTELVEWVRSQAHELKQALAAHLTTWQTADRLHLSDGARDDLRKRVR